VGLSDHTLDNTACIASIALGGSVIEKHLTLRRADGGPDAGFSLEPEEFTAMVNAVRTAELSMGRVHYGTSDADKGSLKYRRAIFLRRPVAKGARLAAQDLVMLRPAAGLPPTVIDQVLGSIMARDAKPGEPLTADMVHWKDGAAPSCC
jgi:N-acetylneuraminate synthase